jgi:hypothetical protein
VSRAPQQKAVPHVRSGSKPESTIFGLMSAPAGCGHNAKFGFVSPVPCTRSRPPDRKLVGMTKE